MINEELVDIYDQGKLAGVLHLPEKNHHPCPIVIYCPGKNGERYEVHRLAVKLGRYLAKQGIAFLRFDYYGLGLSDGFYYEMTTSTKISNVLKVYKYCSTLSEVNQEQVLFLGFSDGARIALMVANILQRNHIILWSPLFYEFSGNLPYNKKPRFNRLSTNPKYLVMPWAGLWISMDFYRDLHTIHIEDELNNYKGDSLVIYGKDDPLIEEEFNYLETTKYDIYKKSIKNKVIPVLGAGHLFTSVLFERVLINETFQWIKSKFAKGES